MVEVSDFRDALVGHRATLVIVDDARLCAALVAAGVKSWVDPLVAATQVLVETGCILDGCELQEEEKHG
jgi:hypothetical protein